MELISCLLLGSAVGLVSSFLGVGGGIFIVPLLPTIAGVSSSQAVGTSLFTVFLVTSKNIYAFNKKRQVPWAAALNLAIGASIATFLTSMVLDQINESYLVLALAAVLLGTAIRLFFQGKAEPIKDSEITKSFDYRALVLGFFCGSIVGVTGIGGGILYGPLLLGFKMVKEEQMAPGSNVVMFCSSLMASIGFALNADEIDFPNLGLIRMDLALMIFASAFVLSKIGHKYQGGIDPKKRKWIMASLLVLMFIKTIWRYFA